jgi:hypothetical protein
MVADSKRSGRKKPVTTTWVHVFEQDTPEGAVYLPADDPNIPLSRRPRERIELSAGGKATLLVPGPDDRYVPQPARWTEGKDVAARDASGTIKVRIVERSPNRLVIRIGK